MDARFGPSQTTKAPGVAEQRNVVTIAPYAAATTAAISTV
jgi:hypothetical protein